MNRFRILFAVLLCALCAGVQAQWQWIDKDGRKVYSDRAPPPDIPAKNIIKQPGKVAAAPSVAAASAAVAPASAPATNAIAGGAVPKLSSTEQELIDKKKQAESAAAEKVRAEQAKAAKIKADNCETAKRGKTLLESGVRVSLKTNSLGEREILDDAGRAAELKRIQAAIDAECK